MRLALSIASVLLVSVLLAIPGSAQGSCGSWQNLSVLGSFGYSGQPTVFAKDTQADKLYAVGQCYCGWHGINFPTFYQHSGSVWVPFGQDFEQGEIKGMDMLDDGSGRALHAWGSEQGWGVPGGFIKLGPTGWVQASAPTLIHMQDVKVFDDGTGPAMYAAWQSGVSRWNGTSWVSIGATLPVNGVARTLLVHDDGTGQALYASGGFTSIDGVAIEGIARWNGTSWSALGSGLTSTTPAQTWIPILRSFHDHGGAALYAGGRFTTSGGPPVRNIARWNGMTWTSLAAGLPAGNYINGLEWFDEGLGTGPHLIASGNAGTTAAGYVVRHEGGTWVPLPALASGNSLLGGALVVFDRPETPGQDLITAGFHGTDWYSPAMFGLAACPSTGELVCLGDGSSGPCPCGNASAPSEGAGCNHSFGYGGALRAHGTASITEDTLSLDGSAMTNSSALYFQGGTQHAPVFFGDGIKCTGGPFVRFATKSNVNGASSYPSPGEAAVSVKGNVGAPGMRHYQVRYRNAAVFCSNDTFNYTNAVSILWAP